MKPDKLERYKSDVFTLLLPLLVLACYSDPEVGYDKPPTSRMTELTVHLQPGDTIYVRCDTLIFRGAPQP